MTNHMSAFDIFLHETHVGTISYVVATDLTSFILSPGYMGMAPDIRPIFSLSLRNKFGTFARTAQHTMVSLPPFFANLLPEKEGALRKFLIRRGRVSPTHEFRILELLRDDLPGAVTLMPTPGQPVELDLTTPTNLDASINDSANEPLRFSLAGLQLKFSASMHSGRLTIPMSGIGGSWIVKLPSPAYPFIPENEFATMRFAESIGINVPEIALIDTNSISNLPPEMSVDSKSFAIRRFDRAASGRRIHIEDFAQVFNVPPSDKYEKASYMNIAHVLRLETDEDDIIEFVRRLVFSIVMGNADMHLKNWSLTYENPTVPKLSPAYDLLSTVVYPGTDTKLALSLSKTKNMQKIQMNHMKKLAADAMLPESLVVKTVKETVNKIAANWSDYRSSFPKTLLPALESHMMSVPFWPEITPPMIAIPHLQTNSKKTVDEDEPIGIDTQPKAE